MEHIKPIFNIIFLAVSIFYLIAASFTKDDVRGAKYMAWATLATIFLLHG